MDRLRTAPAWRSARSTGSLWRVHCSMRLPSPVCDPVVVTGTEGVGTGESFRRFPVAAGDPLTGDRGCATASGIAHLAASGGRVMVRVSTGSLSFVLVDGRRFDLRKAVSAPDRPGAGRRDQEVRRGDRDRPREASPEGGQERQNSEAAAGGRTPPTRHAASRIRSRMRCSRAVGTCSPCATWSSSTPRRSLSPAKAAEPSGAASARGVVVRTARRWCRALC